MLPLRLVDCFLEMLVILCGIPVAAPGEAVFGKEAVAQIIFVNFIGEVLAAVSVNFTAGRGDIGISAAVFVKDNVGVVVGIHIYGKAIGMLGKARSAVNNPVIKAGGVVVRHGSGIVAAVFVYQAHTLEPVFVSI